MSKQTVRKPLSIALGAAVLALGTTGVANAAEGQGNLFSMQDLGSGYLLAGAHGGKDKDKDKDKKDGEGSCGEDKGGEGKCGEGKCGSA